MRCFGISLPLNAKRSVLFANTSSYNKQLSHKHKFYTSKSYSSSYNYSVGKDQHALAIALAQSAISKSFFLGTQIHGHIIKLGFSNETFTQNNLIKMYSECGVLPNGLKVFDEMPKRNLVSWTLIISGANQNDEYDIALETYLEMTRTGFIPNEFALASVVKVCTSVGATELGLCIHCTSLKTGNEKNPFVGCSILNMYAKFGDMVAAEKVFERMDSLDTGCWNGIIGGYVHCGFGFEALKTVSLMHSKGIAMDKFSFINALKGCSLVGDPTFGRQIHGLVIRSDTKLNTSVMNSLMDMYFKNGEKDLALKLFSKIQHKDIVSWNTVFSGYFQDVDATEVARLFNNFMLTNLKPNRATFSILFRLCGDALELDLGLEFLSLAIHFGFQYESHVVSCLINMFSRCGAMEMARAVFDSVPFKNISNWNEIICGYHLSCDLEALKLFYNLWESGIEANECTFSTILEACSQTGNLQLARQIHGIVVKSGFTSNGYVGSSLIKGYVKSGFLDDSFHILDALGIFNMASWGTMTSVLVRRGFVSEAIKLLNCLKEDGGQPDEFILGSILNGCAGISSLWETKSVNSLVIKMGFQTNVFVASAVIDAYAKCGDIESASMAFNESSKFPDVVLLNTMIMGYAHHGFVLEAMDVFKKLKLANLQPSQATFVSVMLAFGHMGLFDQGRDFFKAIALDYGMEPTSEIYGCLVDMYSRNGFLEQAKHLIEAMPYPAWPAILRSVLNGSRIHGDRDMGGWASKKLLQLVPNNDVAYVLLSKVYSEDGNWEEASKYSPMVVLCLPRKKGPLHHMQRKFVQKMMFRKMLQTWYGITTYSGNPCNQEVVTCPYWVSFNRLKRVLVLSLILERSSLKQPSLYLALAGF